MKTTFLTLAVVVLPAFMSLAQRWEPYNELGDLYPSFAIAVANLVPGEGSGKAENALGDPNGFMGITFTPAHDNTRIQLELRCDNSLKLFEPARIDVTLPHAGEEYLITPLVPFNQAKLASLRQSATTYLTYHLTIDGQPQAPRTERLRVHSINDCPFAVVDKNGNETATDYVFAAYVNEDHPQVQAILRDALRRGYVEEFAGYQGGRTDVYRQVAAIWRVLQERDIRYSSTTAVAAKANGVSAQHVRLIDESLAYNQANCADGSVLFASILRKIDLNPVLVVVPGHMFVGFDLDEEGSEQAYFETSLVDARPADLTADQLYRTLLGNRVDTKSQLALKSFVAALEAGAALFDEHESRILAGKPGYALVDIAASRDAGVAPIMASGSGPSSR